MKKKGVTMRLFGYTKPFAYLLIPAFLSAVISVLLSLYVPILVGRGIDYIIGKNNVDFPMIRKYVITIFITVILSSVFNWIMSFCTYKITYRAVSDMRKELYAKFNRLPLGYIDSTPHGDLIGRMSADIELISDGMLQCFSQFLTGIVTIVGTIVFMIRINVRVALIVVLITPLSLFAAAFITKLCRDKFKEQSAIRGELTGCAEELIGGQKVVKAFAYESRANEKFSEINGRLYKCGVLAQFFSALTNPTTRFVNGIVYAAAGVFGAISVISGAAVFIEDAAFTALFAAAFYGYCTELCRGQLRFFVFAAMLLGFGAYLATLGRLVSKLVSTVVKSVRKSIICLGKIAKKAIKLLCGVTYFQKREEKFQENPCVNKNF